MKNKTRFILILFLISLLIVTATLRASAAVDDSYTKVLLHMDGTDGSTTFTDDSGKTWTRSGDAQIDTAQYKFGTASGLFDGTGDYIYTSDSDDFYFDGDFTIDWWMMFNSLPASSQEQNIFAQYKDLSNSYRFTIYNTGTQYSIKFIDIENGSYVFDMTRNYGALSTGQWYHFAIVRNGSNFYIFVDGQQVGTTITDSDAMGNIAGALRVGYYPSNYLNGWIDEFRVSKGISRWTSNFTPQSSQYEPTSTPTNTATFTATATDTPTSTPTDTATFTPTNTSTPTETFTPTNTSPAPTSTFTDTPTYTATYTPTITPSPTATGPTSTHAAPTAYFDGEISYGQVGVAVSLSILLLVAIIWLLMWLALKLVPSRKGKK